MKSINIMYAGGYWATNMGNAFYNLGVQYALKAANPNANIVFTSDLPEYAWNRYNSQNVNSFCCLNCLEGIDYLVFAGPMLSWLYLKYWENIIEVAKRKGVKIVLLSAGCSSYNEVEKEKVTEFLRKHHFYALFSRDEYTYLTFRKYFDYSYNGICCAFYIPEYFTPYAMDINPYVVMNFETYEEPIFEESDLQWRFEFMGKAYYYDEKLKKIKKRIFKRKYTDTLGEYSIIRTKHTVFRPLIPYGGGIFIYLMFHMIILIFMLMQQQCFRIEYMPV